MRVRDLMEKELVTLEASDTLDLADDLMQLGRIRHMPVVSRAGVVGILSQRDLFRAAVSSALRFRRAVEKEWLAKIPVQEVMTSHVFTVGPDDSVRSAVDLMLAKRIGCVPVVEGGKLVGLLSESDCLRYLARLLAIAEEKEDLPELPPST
jgi:CBS domain-containing membrane protein